MVVESDPAPILESKDAQLQKPETSGKNRSASFFSTSPFLTLNSKQR